MNCKIANKCGGCKYINDSYENSLIEKEKYVKNLFKNEKVNKIIGMENPLNYRNKGKFVVKNGKLGFFEEGTHNVVVEENCLIQNDTINKIAKFTFDVLMKNHISIYNEDTKKGFLRHIIIRYGTFSNEVMIILVTTNGKIQNRDKIIKELLSKFNNIKSIVQNINEKETSAILGNKNYNLYGKGYIVDYVKGMKFKISALSFYQVNSIQMEKLYDEAINKAYITKNDIVYDLYSGIGTISLCMANKSKFVYGIEIVKDAVEMAKENARLNHINNVAFISGKVEDNLNKLILKNIPDVVIVDPPRCGLDNKTIEILFDLKVKKIIYISCGPEALLENLKSLKKFYKVDSITPVDMFPFTDNIENIAVLNLKNDGELKNKSFKKNSNFKKKDTLITKKSKDKRVNRG